jgi:hypothetical protein
MVELSKSCEEAGLEAFLSLVPPGKEILFLGRRQQNDEVCRVVAKFYSTQCAILLRFLEAQAGPTGGAVKYHSTPIILLARGSIHGSNVRVRLASSGTLPFTAGSC